MSAMAVAPGIGRVVPARDARTRGGSAHEARRAPAGELRLTARGRAVLIVLALALVGLVGLMGGRALAAGDPARTPAVVEHVVAPGETLWDIAATVTPAGESVNSTVGQLVRLNGLSSDQLMAGQTIALPRG
ncbi:LysM peptidoglycan-binding domain-containing protein [Cellulomonas massiliensis]|uniref:LysM peptidoglycan-binding domain-containing protein n=1 Tax=Cellulomonas massiliensis TaxID=1465811 RepID=UPI0011C7CE40|nr:LysM peptidoglycan-binding domain-containing protein [Cellulomonas massiliensis]